MTGGRADDVEFPGVAVDVRGRFDAVVVDVGGFRGGSEEVATTGTVEVAIAGVLCSACSWDGSEAVGACDPMTALFCPSLCEAAACGSLGLSCGASDPRADWSWEAGGSEAFAWF